LSLGSWIAKSADGFVHDAASFFAMGLKEKENLRRAHLRSLRLACQNSDILTWMIPLAEPFIQLVKSGASKPAQRLEGMYALFLVAKIAAVDAKADEILAKEKIWQLVFQMDSSLISTTLASKLSSDDCLAFMDLVEVLLLEHPHRVTEYSGSKQLLWSAGEWKL